MFSNIGRKIKGLAKFLCWFGIILSVVFGFLIIFNTVNLSFNDNYGSYYRNAASAVNAASVIAGLLVMGIGSVCSWLSSLVLYGFGQLVENSDDIKQRLYSQS